jgi:hypothetical protein
MASEDNLIKNLSDNLLEKTKDYLQSEMKCTIDNYRLLDSMNKVTIKVSKKYNNNKFEKEFHLCSANLGNALVFFHASSCSCFCLFTEV